MSIWICVRGPHGCPDHATCPETYLTQPQSTPTHTHGGREGAEGGRCRPQHPSCLTADVR
eukprot:6017667-Prymnesium_polylepis.2